MEHTIAIVGCGPHGMISFERLVAQLGAAPLEGEVHLHLFNHTDRFGPGDVFDPGQPDCFLLNTSFADFNVWPSEAPSGIVDDRPSLLDWCRRHRIPPVPVANDDHGPRSLAGRYLTECFDAIVHSLPDGIVLHRHVGEVVDLEPHDGHYRVIFRAAGSTGVTSSVECDKVLLTTGHTRPRQTAEEAEYTRLADRHAQSNFIPDIYPVEKMRGRIPAGSRVGIKGMGLTFVDAVLYLTQGTGGRFERGPAGELRYLPSGDEPACIYPFSRSGLPTRPRASDLSHYQHELVFCTVEAHEALRQGSPDGKIDFVEDLWPLYEQEMEWAYYRLLMAQRGEEGKLRSCGADRAALSSLIEDFLRRYPEVRRFDARRLLDPIGARDFESGREFDSFVVEHLRSEQRKAVRGAAEDAEKAAVEVWRFCRKISRPFIARGGLTPDSHRRLHTEIWPRMQHLVFGPPIGNSEKVLALAAAGLVDFSIGLGPEVLPCQDSGTFRLLCRRTASEVEVESLIDARVPSISLPLDASLLYQNLLRRGLVRVFENGRPGATSYQPGAIDSTPDEGLVFGADGHVNPDLAVVGIPTHGNIYDSSPLAGDRGLATAAWAANLVAQLRSKERRAGLRLKTGT